MSRVIDRHEFVQYRESPSGLERYGATFGNLTPELVAAHTVAFRTSRESEWLAATANSIYMVSPGTWEKWPLVEDPLA
jgi:hypothetical protein